MRLHILGSGTVDPLCHRACAGYMVDSSQGPLLMDLGNGALRRAHELGLPAARCDRLFLTHLHPDHTADIVPLLFARNYAPSPWSEESRELHIFGPKGLSDFLNHIFQAWPSIRPREGRPQIHLHELSLQDQMVWIQGEVTVRAIPVEHGDMNAFGFRITDGDRSLAYSGDSRLCSSLEDLARGVDLFVCECSCFPRGCEPLKCRDVHLSWEDVRDVCVQAQPNKLVLTHLYEPVLRRKPSPEELLAKVLDIPVRLAEDGQVYEL